MSSKIVQFEIHAADPERAMKFYQDVFDWEFPMWIEKPPYWGIMTAPEGSEEPGINGGLMERKEESPRDGAPVNAYVCTVQAELFDEIHDKIFRAGGQIAVPKHAITGMAWQGYYKDTEGNLFGVHQAHESAK